MKRKALLRCLPARVPSSPRRITTALPLSPSATAFTVPAYPPDRPTSKPFTEAESVLPATSLLEKFPSSLRVHSALKRSSIHCLQTAALTPTLWNKRAAMCPSLSCPWTVSFRCPITPSSRATTPASQKPPLPLSPSAPVAWSTSRSQRLATLPWIPLLTFSRTSPTPLQNSATRSSLFSSLGVPLCSSSSRPKFVSCRTIYGRTSLQSFALPCSKNSALMAANLNRTPF